MPSLPVTCSQVLIENKAGRTITIEDITDNVIGIISCIISDMH